MDINIIEPVTSYIKIFKTIDEFNLFYSKNKDHLNRLTTHMLNKMYCVEGYRLTKVKGELSLRKYDDTMKRYFSRKDEADLRDSEIIRIDNEIIRLNKEIAEIRDGVNRIIKYLNPNADVEGDASEKYS